MKILILKPSSLGDVIQALPVLRLLKRRYPQSDIHWWLSTDLLPLLQSDPDLAGVVPFDRRRWGAPHHWPELLSSVRQMRRLRFDWVIDLQSLLRSALFAWLANGATTIGLDDPREGAPAFYDVAVARPSPQTHAVDWYLQVLVEMRIPIHWDFAWLPTRPEVAAAVRRRWNLDAGPLILLNPGARWPNKRWPAGHFAELARILSRRLPAARFAVLGGPSDNPLAQIVCQSDPVRCLNLAGKTSLPELVELIRLAALIVTNDTGPMHIAAAMKKPVVALFGPTNPYRTGPYGQQAEALRPTLSCSPCMQSRCATPANHLSCLSGIAPERVADAVEARLVAFAACQDSGS